MYFPHAFRKAFLPKPNSGVVGIAQSGNTAALTAGQIGFFDPKTFTAVTTGTKAPFIIAQGSYFAADKIGPFHGGYKESVKSKMINPRYISRFIKVTAQTSRNQIKTITIGDVTCDKTYRMRLDIKGSPALRFLDRNMYKTLDAYTGCCGADETANVDPTVVAIQWARQINQDPFISKFIQAAVKDSTGADVAPANYDSFTPDTTVTNTDTAQVIITVAYVDTKFGNCTFTTTDFYELEPLFVYASFQDDSGDPCNTQLFSVVETQAPRQASGVGETVVRDMILDGRYRQEVFPDNSHVDSLRRREIEGNPVVSAVDRNGLYDQIMLLHNVPRFNNPSSQFDNDQYLIVMHVPTGSTTTAITDFITQALTAVNSTVTIENL